MNALLWKLLLIIETSALSLLVQQSRWTLCVCQRRIGSHLSIIRQRKSIKSQNLLNFKVHYPAARRQKSHYRNSTRRYSSVTCFTSGKKGNGYVACPDRVCSHCHRSGYDAPNCPSSDGEWSRNANHRRRDYVKKVNERLMDENSASISVKVRGLVVCALLDQK